MRSSLLLLPLIFLQLIPAEQQLMASTFEHAMSGACNDPVFDTVNATGSVQFKGLVDLDNTTHTWTLSTAIHATHSGPEGYPANSSNLWQTWWLNTSPVMQPNTTTIPYQGCLIALSGFKKTPVLDTPSDAATCAGVFDSQCYDDIINDFGWTAADADYEDAQTSCQQLAASMKPPKSCKGMEWSTNATAPLFQTQSLNATNSCTADVFNGSATRNGGLLGLTSYFEPNDEYTIYDTWVRQATPMVLLTFRGGYYEEQWTYGRTYLTCLSASNITEGSRVPPNTTTGTSSAASTISSPTLWIQVSMFGAGWWILLWIMNLW